VDHVRFNAPPGWPSPPNDWVPDATWRPDPSWPAAPPGWQWWVPTQVQPTAPMAWPAQPPQTHAQPPQTYTQPPRSTGTRVALTLLILLGPWLAYLAACFAFGLYLGFSASGKPSYQTDQTIHDVVSVLTWLLVIGYLAWFAFVATKVSYRWFDTFRLLIPIYGWIWLVRMSWRMANLPHKDWPARDDDPSAGQWPPAQQWTPTPQWAPPAATNGVGGQPLSGYYPPATFDS
jgi:hypothetical protein